MERNYQKRQQHDALIRVSDLNYKLRLYGKRFIIFALLFYVCVPLFYYYLWLGWTAIDAFYVSQPAKLASTLACTSLQPVRYLACFGAPVAPAWTAVLLRDVLHSGLRGHHPALH